MSDEDEDEDEDVLLCLTRHTSPAASLLVCYSPE